MLHPQEIGQQHTTTTTTQTLNHRLEDIKKDH